MRQVTTTNECSSRSCNPLKFLLLLLLLGRLLRPLNDWRWRHRSRACFGKLFIAGVIQYRTDANIDRLSLAGAAPVDAAHRCYISIIPAVSNANMP